VPLLTLAEAKQQLDIETTSHDTELQVYVDSLASVIEAYVGAVEVREVTETVDGSGPLLALRTTPVISLTSLTPVLDGRTTPDVARLVVDGPSGVVRHLGGEQFARGPWTAVYSAGRPVVPATIKLAALILLQHLWRTQYGASRALSGVGGGDDFSVSDPAPGWGYAVPNRVLQLLEPFKIGPGIA
jgi:hypothetical protein